jgi:hypothetical protein
VFLLCDMAHSHIDHLTNFPCAPNGHHLKYIVYLQCIYTIVYTAVDIVGLTLYTVDPFLRTMQRTYDVSAAIIYSDFSCFNNSLLIWRRSATCLDFYFVDGTWIERTTLITQTCFNIQKTDHHGATTSYIEHARVHLANPHWYAAYSVYDSGKVLFHSEQCSKCVGFDH